MVSCDRRRDQVFTNVTEPSFNDKEMPRVPVECQESCLQIITTWQVIGKNKGSTLCLDMPRSIQKLVEVAMSESRWCHEEQVLQFTLGSMSAFMKFRSMFI